MSVLGVHVFPEGIRIATGSHGRKGLRVRGRTEYVFEKGTVHKGVIVQTEAAAVAVRALIKKTPSLRGKKVMLCLSPEQVYGTTLTVPGLQRPIIEQELARWMPETMQSLVYAYAPVRKGEQGTDIAVIAVRRDVLDGALALCRAASWKVVGVTTISHALRAALPHGNNPMMLLHAGLSVPTVTLFQGNTLLDEAVFPMHATGEHMLAGAESLAAEYWDRFPVRDMFVTAPKESLLALQDALQPAKVVTKKKQKEQPEQKESWCALHPVFSEIASEDQPFLGALCASLTRGTVFRMRRRFGHRVLWLGIVLAAIMGIGGVYVWSTRDVPVIPLVEEETIPLESAEVSEPMELSPDVPADHPAFTALAWALDRGIFEQDGSGMVLPDRVLRRFEFLTLVVDRTADVDITSITERSGHVDVEASGPYLFHVRYATQQGFLDGSLFRPEDPITVVEALRMAYGAYGVTVPAPAAGEEWFAPYVRSMQERQIFVGDMPASGAPMTRAMVAELLMNIAS